MRGVSRLFLIALSVLFVVALAFAADNPAAKPAVAPPKARVDVVTDTVHGQQISDPYRWLEDGANPEVQKFTQDQFNYTESVLHKQSQYERIKSRLTELFKIGTVNSPHIAGKYYFYTRRDAGQNQPILYVREGINGKDRVLVDANTMSADGTVALDWWQESNDGKYVAFGTSPGGSEISNLQIVETATGKLLDEKIDRCRAASIGWLADNSGFYYTKLPRPGDVPAGQEMYNRHVFFHKIGTNPDGRADAEVFGKGRSPQEWPNVFVSDDGRWLVILAGVTFERTDVFLKDLKANSDLKTVTEGRDFNYGVEIHDGQMYIFTNDGAPKYHIYKVTAENPSRENWKEIVPENESVLKNMQMARETMLLEYEQVAVSKLQIHDRDGKFIRDVKMPTLGNVTSLTGSSKSETAFFGFNSFTVPPAVYSLDVKSSKTGEWAKVASNIDSNAYETKQVFYTSKDGTKVPMFLVYKKGVKLDGKNPTMLAGYGGFNISRTPTFNNWLMVWLENGGIYADAGLRGGSEYGEGWHKAGMLDRKQNVFDDFYAAAEYLIANKYTDKEHIGAYGRSNGGLLTGAAMTQRPDLFKAVVCGVPLLDMLRYHQFQIAKLWIPEYGSAENPEQFKFISAYSPYQHVKENTQYPAILFFASEGDTRVDPLHARKMTALLQASATNSPDRPILLRILSKAGHGAGKPVTKQVEEWADIFTFLFWQTGIK
jgi:prolyl oligopeptidase